MLKLANIIVKLIISFLVFCIILGGSILYFKGRKIGTEISNVIEDNKQLVIRHTNELSNVIDKNMCYTDDVTGISIFIDDYIVGDEFITIYFTADTTMLNLKEKDLDDKYKDGIKPYGTLSLMSISEETNLLDKEFYDAFMSECFLSSYHLTNHYVDIPINQKVHKCHESEYGHMNRLSEAFRNKTHQLGLLGYKSKTSFSVELKKNKNRILIIDINSSLMEDGHRMFYLLVKDL